MGAVTSVVVAAVGAAASIHGQQQQAKQAKAAANYNAMVAEKNAKLSVAKAADEERRFRILRRKEAGSNKAALSASGVKLEGSPLEVLRSNARNAEADAINIRKYGAQTASALREEAAFQRRSGRSASRAADTLSVATGIRAGADIYSRVGGSS